MTNEDAVNMIGQLRMYISGGGVIDRKLDEAVQMAIEALKELGNQSQEVNNSNDCISRQAAIDAFKPYADYESNRTNADWVRRIELVLNDLPSVQPEPCDVCVHKDDCGDMRIYCPAERRTDG